MPPPNQTTAGVSAGIAAIIRTFMCTVGTWGLRGCMTSDTPIASNAAPANSGRACVAEGGSAGPRTWLKLQPPRSSTGPASINTLRPSPCNRSPGSRTQASSRTALPSHSVMATTTRCCKPSR